MATKTIDERIAELQKKQSQLKAQEKALKAKQAQKERKNRTKRLIEIGAILEKATGITFDSQPKKEALLEVLTKERMGRYGTFYTYGNNIRQLMEKEIKRQEEAATDRQLPTT